MYTIRLTSPVLTYYDRVHKIIKQFPEYKMVDWEKMLESRIDKHLCFAGDQLPPPSSYPGEGSLPRSQDSTFGCHPEPYESRQYPQNPISLKPNVIISSHLLITDLYTFLPFLRLTVIFPSIPHLCLPCTLLPLSFQLKFCSHITSAQILLDFVTLTTQGKGQQQVACMSIF